MGGRGRAVRHLPFAVPVQQGGFFLRSRKRNPKLLILADAERTSREVADDFAISSSLTGRASITPVWPTATRSGRN
jgi:hypothetical protein